MTRRVRAQVLGHVLVLVLAHDGAAAQDAGRPAPPDAGPAIEAAEAEELPAEDRPELGMTLRPTRGLVTGDLLHVTIQAVAAEGDDVTVPDQSLAPFEVHRRRARVESLSDGRSRFVFDLDLLVLEPGELRLPEIRLRVVTEDGRIGTVQTSGRNIHVGSALGNEPNAQPKPPTPPRPVFEKDYTLLWILGAIAALALTAALTLLIARWWRRREKPLPPPPPPRPPWEIAIEKLDALRRTQPQAHAEGTVVAWIDGVSDALREYLGLRYAFDGLESTTDEIVVHLRRATLPQGVFDESLAVLRDCDLVKFAKFVPDADETNRILEGAYRIVRSTMYQSVAAPPPVRTSPADGVRPGPGGAA